MEAIVIPVKAPGSGKSRLGPTLSLEQRTRLGMVMLQDILAASDGWENRFVVTDDQATADAALESGCTSITDPGRGLNVAVEVATSAAIKAGASTVLVIPSDVPLVASTDIETLFQRNEPVALVPSRDGGTNALKRTPPDAIPLSFGPQSSTAHLEAAASGGLEGARLDLESLALDVDALEDLMELAKSDQVRGSVVLARELVKSVKLRGLGAPDRP